jgi:hypothetical protein
MVFVTSCGLEKDRIEGGGFDELEVLEARQ